LIKKRTALAGAVKGRKERKQFCAFSARPPFHKAWTQLGHQLKRTTTLGPVLMRLRADTLKQID
jgi:hypothetical protein